jgi:hypothetical protein
VSKHRATCTYHCRECDSHFSSLTAFDKHRIFEEGHEGDWEFRVCAEPADLRMKSGEPALVQKAVSGVCRLQRGGERSGVTIWTVPFDTAFTWPSAEKAA